jgi:predicted Zn finger-like uncharacterized protein
MLTKKIACPACSARLRIAEALPAGKRLKCPKCGDRFPAPDDSDNTPPPEMASVKRKKKPHPAPELDWGEAVEKHPIYQTRRKLWKKKGGSTRIGRGVALIIVVLLIGAGATLLWFLRASSARNSAAVDNSQRPSTSERATQ